MFHQTSDHVTSTNVRVVQTTIRVIIARLDKRGNHEIRKNKRKTAESSIQTTECYPTAPFWLKREQGGMEAPSIRELLLKEMKSHITSCLQSEDEIKQLLIESA